MVFKILLLNLVALVATNIVQTSDKKVICYYGTWANYRPEPAKFEVDDIQVDLCTHIIYTFVGIDDNGTAVSLDSYLDLSDGLDYFNKFNALKEKNPNSKTVLAVGGWNEGSAKYSNMAASPALRKNFISSIVDLIFRYGFDGCDINWNYPNRRDTTNGEADIENFSILLKEMRAEFDKHSFLLSAAVAGTGESAELSYDIPTISQYLDWVGIMAYDFYGSFDVTRHNAALYQSEADATVTASTTDIAICTVENAVNYWLGAGCPPEKLVLGVPFYGRSFTLEDINQHNVGSPSTGAGLPGPYTQEDGNIGYNELCDIIKTEAWTVEYDDLAKVPYAFIDNDWVSFDNADSLSEKVNFAIEKNIAGVMIWSIETDDFQGTCGEANPLLKAINRAFGKIDDEHQYALGYTLLGVAVVATLGWVARKHSPRPRRNKAPERSSRKRR